MNIFRHKLYVLEQKVKATMDHYRVPEMLAFSKSPMQSDEAIPQLANCKKGPNQAYRKAVHTLTVLQADILDLDPPCAEAVMERDCVIDLLDIHFRKLSAVAEDHWHKAKQSCGLVPHAAEPAHQFGLLKAIPEYFDTGLFLLKPELL